MRKIIIILLVIGIGVAAYVMYGMDRGGDSLSDSHKYENADFSFAYPSVLTLKEASQGVELSHSIAHTHWNVCDFKGGGEPLASFVDFDVDLKVVDLGLKEYLLANYSGWDSFGEYVSKNPYELGGMKGYKVSEGVEGCGRETYYFEVGPKKTFIMHRKYITEFEMGESSKPYTQLEGVILPEQAETYFSQFLSSLKIKGLSK